MATDRPSAWAQARFVVGLLHGSWMRIVLLYLLPIALLESGVVIATREAVGRSAPTGVGGHGVGGVTTAMVVSALSVIGFFVVRAVLVSAIWHALLRKVADVQVALSSRLFGAFLYRPYAALVADDRSRMLESLRSTTHGLLLHLLRPVLTAVSEIMVALGIVAVLLAVAPLATLVLLGWMALAFGAMALVTVRLARRFGSVRWAAVHELRQLADYAFREIRMVRQSGAETVIEADFRSRSRSFADAVASDIALANTPRYFGELALLSSVMLVGLLFLTGGFGGTPGVRDVAIFAVAGLRLLPAAQRMIGIAQQFQNNAPDLSQAIADLHGERLDLPPVEHPGAAPFERELALVDIGFRYGGGPWVVKPGTSLSLARGDWLHVSGPSGAGKSTLLTVLLGFVAPCRGHVEIDAVPRAPLEWFRGRAIAIVPQEPGLIGGTVADNLAFPFPRAAIDRERAVAILTALALPDDLDADVGDQGIALSGGQRQRLAIARAILTMPDLLVLDEATSQLDDDNEARVWEAVRGFLPGVTLIAVAHRLGRPATFNAAWQAIDGIWTASRRDSPPDRQPDPAA